MQGYFIYQLCEQYEGPFGWPILKANEGQDHALLAKELLNQHEGCDYVSICIYNLAMEQIGQAWVN